MVKLVKLIGSSADVKKVVRDMRSNIEYDRTPVKVKVSEIRTMVVFKK